MMRGWTMLVAAGLVVGACATSDDSGLGPADTVDVGASTADGSTPSSPSSVPASTEPSRAVPPPTPPKRSTTARPAQAATLPAPVNDVSHTVPYTGVDDDGSFREPTFDLGPDVVLDVDDAGFPVDDAGRGGTQATMLDAPVDPEADPVTGWAAVDRYLDSVLIRPGNTAASVAVAIDGKIVHREAFGVRDPSTSDPAEPVDRFRIASISKPITAITALQLVEEGMVGLDDPIGQLVADHVGLGPVSAGTTSLTLRALLGHRSGLGSFQPTFFGTDAVDCADAARQGLSRGTSGTGGYVYSNMNYCVAGMLIEALTGLTYEQAAYTYLLTPLGISGMRLAPTVDPGPDEIQHVTTPGRNYMETLGAAGAWLATPSDLVTIIDSLDPTTPGFTPLEPDTVMQMEVPPGASFGARGYGLGVISYGAGRIGHTGTIESTHAMLLDRGDGVTWAITVAGQFPGESTDLERVMNDAFAAGGFVAG